MGAIIAKEVVPNMSAKSGKHAHEILPETVERKMAEEITSTPITSILNSFCGVGRCYIKCNYASV